jgi:hypothetical protein
LPCQYWRWIRGLPCRNSLFSSQRTMMQISLISCLYLQCISRTKYDANDDAPSFDWTKYVHYMDNLLI